MGVLVINSGVPWTFSSAILLHLHGRARAGLEVKPWELPLFTGGNGDRRASQVDKIQQIQLHVIPLLKAPKYPITCTVKPELIIWFHPIFPKYFQLQPRVKRSVQPRSSPQPPKSTVLCLYLGLHTHKIIGLKCSPHVTRLKILITILGGIWISL